MLPIKRTNALSVQNSHLQVRKTARLCLLGTSKWTSKKAKLTISACSVLTECLSSTPRNALRITSKWIYNSTQQEWKVQAQLWGFWKSGWGAHQCFGRQSPSSLSNLTKQTCPICYQVCWQLQPLESKSSDRLNTHSLDFWALPCMWPPSPALNTWKLCRVSCLRAGWPSQAPRRLNLTVCGTLQDIALQHSLYHVVQHSLCHQAPHISRFSGLFHEQTEKDQGNTADDTPFNISHLQQLLVKRYLNGKQALCHNFPISLFITSHKRREWPTKQQENIKDGHRTQWLCCSVSKGSSPSQIKGTTWCSPRKSLQDNVSKHFRITFSSFLLFPFLSFCLPFHFIIPGKRYWQPFTSVQKLSYNLQRQPNNTWWALRSSISQACNCQERFTQISPRELKPLCAITFHVLGMFPFHADTTVYVCSASLAHGTRGVGTSQTPQCFHLRRVVGRKRNCLRVTHALESGIKTTKHEVN